MRRPRGPLSAGGLSFTLLLSGLAGSRGAVEERESNVTTPYGYLMVREFGDEKAREVALAIHGGIRREEILHEWDYVARSLALSGQYKVLLPSFFSNSRLEPGRLRTEASVAVVRRLMELFARGGPLSLLLGKSWGGAMAAKLAAAKPEFVSRLVLVAPGRLADLAAPIGCRTVLFWAKDDKAGCGGRSPSPPGRALCRREECAEGAEERGRGARVAFYAPPEGGHFVRHSYAEAVVAFATDADVLPDLNGWRVKAKDGSAGSDGGEDPEAPPPSEDETGSQQLLLLTVFGIVSVTGCCLVALGVFYAVDWWEGKGRYIVRHLKPPSARARPVGAPMSDEELQFDPWE